MRYRNWIRSCVGVAAIITVGGAFAGTVTGTVVFEGEAPAMQPVKMDADAQCSAMRPPHMPLLNEVLVLGEGQTMANVLVSVSKGLPENGGWPVPEEIFNVTQKKCQYSPHVFGVRVGQKVRFLNPDGILHNVNAMPKNNEAFNRAMPANVLEFTVTFEAPEEPFPVACNVHPWMKAYCAVFDHPFFTVTQTDGVYRIEGLEPGEYEISAWHERLGTQTATVTVSVEGEAKQDFSFTRPQRKTAAAEETR